MPLNLEEFKQLFKEQEEDETRANLELKKAKQRLEERKQDFRERQQLLKEKEVEQKRTQRHNNWVLLFSIASMGLTIFAYMIFIIIIISKH